MEGAYVESANTRGLHQLYAAMLEREATNAAVKNDLAMTSFLLKINLGQAHLLARQAFEQRPDHPSIASTYAYSLHLLGKTSQGLAVLEKFKPEQLESPGVAAYYGTLLAAAGQTDKARIYLRLAGRARLLPEEKALVQEAIKSVGDL